MAVAGELEQAVMEVLWSRTDRLSVREVHSELSRDRDLAYTTVMTVLDRLAKKGNVNRSLEGRAWLYRPARSRVDEVTAKLLAAVGELDPADRLVALRRLEDAVGAGPAEDN